MYRKMIFVLFALMWLVSACGAPTSGTTNNPTTMPPATSALPQPTTASPTTGASVQPTSNAPAATATSARSAQPNAPTGNPFDWILKAEQAQLNAKSFRSRSTTTSADGKTGTTVLEFVTPDRLHMIQATGSEIIAIKGVGTFQKSPNGQWVKSPLDLSDAMFAFMDPKTLDEFRSSIIVSEVKFIGPELLDAKPMFVFQYATLLKGIGPNGSDIAGTHKMWVGVADGLPYKLDGEQDSVVTKGAKTHTVIVYDYDPTIKIEAPIK